MPFPGLGPAELLRRHLVRQLAPAQSARVPLSESIEKYPIGEDLEARYDEGYQCAGGDRQDQNRGVAPFEDPG